MSNVIKILCINRACKLIVEPVNKLFICIIWGI